MASESTNQRASVGTNAPMRSNSDCIRLSLQDHAPAHEIGAKRLRPHNDPVQRFDFRRRRTALGDESMAAEGMCLCYPLAEFPDRGIAQRLRESRQQVRPFAEG